jgi:hypothetical protein
MIKTVAQVLSPRAARAARDEEGSNAIEWAIFALLALAVAGLVAGAITLAVNNRIGGIV